MLVKIEYCLTYNEHDNNHSMNLTMFIPHGLKNEHLHLGDRLFFIFGTMELRVNERHCYALCNYIETSFSWAKFYLFADTDIVIM